VENRLGQQAVIYIGPQIERLLGWSQDSWKSIADWASRIHQGDRENIVNFCPEALLLGFMFDISERKKTEEQLLQLQKQLEEYSYKDGLTDVANRRMFDRVLEQEWLEAKRNQQPLSVIMNQKRSWNL